MKTIATALMLLVAVTFFAAPSSAKPNKGRGQGPPPWANNDKDKWDYRGNGWNNWDWDDDDYRGPAYYGYWGPPPYPDYYNGWNYRYGYNPYWYGLWR